MSQPDYEAEAQEPPIEPDRTGWPLHPRERRDFFNRPHAFPPEVNRWRRNLAARVKAEPDRFPLAASLDGDQLLERIDDGISFLREVARILAVLHASPDLGNKADPTDELVYILLARHTREGAYQEAFDALKKRFPHWDDLLDAPRDEVEGLVYSGGLSGKKTAALFAALARLRETFGRCTLEPARNWPDDRLEEFLCSLPEVERKSAYCIMMYSFGRQVFPADTHAGRILARLGIYRELGLSLEGLDHKKLQRILADLLPPNLRHSLHVNLVQHGREVCRKLNPLCQQCELRNFCASFRQKEAVRVAATTAPTVVDLFAGAGGLSEGFTRAGFRVLAAIEQDPMAMRTFRLNHPAVPDPCLLVQDIREVQEKQLRQLLGAQQVDVLCGSPPCQGISSVGFRSKRSKLGYRMEADDRNFLFEHMMRIALYLKPALFLMENVPGMQSASKKEDSSFLDAAARLLSERGEYRTEIWRLNACAFGVPQDRVRCFLVASRLRMMPARPPEDYQNLRRQNIDLDALPQVTLQEAIFDLPPRAAGQGVAVEDRAVPDASSDPRFRRYLTKFGIVRPSRLLYNHTVRYHNPRRVYNPSSGKRGVVF